MTTKTRSFYGKQLLLKKAPSRGPGEPMIVSMKSLITPCLLGGFNEQNGQARACGRGIQIPLDLEPCVVMCPYCSSLMFISSRQHSNDYLDADLQQTIDGHWYIYGYATYPVSNDQRKLSSRIHTFTSGHGILLAFRFTPDAEQVFGIDQGRYAVMPLAYSEDDLSYCLPQPHGLANYILQTALTSYEIEQYIETIGIAQRVLVIESESQGAHFLLGSSYLRLGRVDEAVHALETTVRIKPDYTTAHLHLGLAYGMQNRADDEIREYKTVLRLDPSCAEAHYNLGVEYAQQGRLNESIQEYQAALKIKPDYANAHGALAWAYANQRQWIESIREYKAAIAIDHTLAHAHFGLASAYEQQGRATESIQELETAARMGFEPAKKSLAQMGIKSKFGEIGQVRFIFDHCGGETLDKAEVPFRTMVEHFLAKIKQEREGAAYVEQVEFQVIYLTESTHLINSLIVAYLVEGYPILEPHEVVESIGHTHPDPSTVLNHCDFLEKGCTGCSVHNQHTQYAGLRNLRLSGNWDKYVEELESTYLYNKAIDLMARIYLMSFLHDHELAGSASRLPPQKVSEVVYERVTLWANIGMNTDPT